MEGGREGRGGKGRGGEGETGGKGYLPTFWEKVTPLQANSNFIGVASYKTL